MSALTTPRINPALLQLLSGPLPFGGEGGIATQGDVLVNVTADGVDLNVIWAEVASVIAAWNAERSALTSLLAFSTYPVIVTEQRSASRQALVAYRGNRYSVPPELAAAQVVVTRPVGGAFIDIATTAGIVIARHKLLADGLGGIVRDSGHVIALDAAAMAAASSGRGHRRKERIPPGPEARAAATELRKRLAAGDRAVIESPITTTDSIVIDLSAYERAAQLRSTLK